MPKPKKEKTLTKKPKMCICVANKTEYTLLIERARASDMTVSSLSEMLTTQNVIIKYEITADVSEIKQLISQFW